MAFVSGYDRIHICPECNEHLQFNLKKGDSGLTIEYRHSIYGLVMVNGYPQSCPNNGKTLGPEQTEDLCQPIIKGGI